MEYSLLDEPTIPPKENHYIVRGRLTCGGEHKKPKFVADFYLKKPYDEKVSPVLMFVKLYADTIKRYKNETEEEFWKRFDQKKWGQHYMYFHHNGFDWCLDYPRYEVLERKRKEKKNVDNQ